MKSILVVEDDKIFRKSIKDLLFEFGYGIMEAGDGAEAFALFRANKPNLIISEIMLPNVNGFDFFQEIKKQLMDESIPVLLLSGIIDGEIIRKADKLGAAEVIGKPCKMSDLLQRVKNCIGI